MTGRRTKVRHVPAARARPARNASDGALQLNLHAQRSRRLCVLPHSHSHKSVPGLPPCSGHRTAEAAGAGLRAAPSHDCTYRTSHSPLSLSNTKLHTASRTRPPCVLEGGKRRLYTRRPRACPHCLAPRSSAPRAMAPASLHARHTCSSALHLSTASNAPPTRVRRTLGRQLRTPEDGPGQRSPRQRQPRARRVGLGRLQQLVPTQQPAAVLHGHPLEGSRGRR